MVQNETEEKSTVNYDERRKLLLQVKSNTTEYKTDPVKKEGEDTEQPKLLQIVKSSMEVEYTEEGIRLAYNGLVKEKEFHDKHLIDLNKNLKDAGEMTTELTKLKEDMATIAKIEEAEKSKKEIKATEDRLKVVNKEINEIKQEIGTRLKL